jgi:hypothetical protein
MRALMPRITTFHGDDGGNNLITRRGPIVRVELR